MNNRRKENGRTYDQPIPKPPDELFADFMRGMEDRLVTKRRDRDRATNRRERTRDQ